MGITLIILSVIAAAVVITVVILIIIFFLRNRKGSLEILPGSYNYSYGETLNAELKINLRKPLLAKKLMIGLYGQKVHDNEKILDYKETLDSNVKMKAGEDSYNFVIEIPSNLPYMISQNEKKQIQPEQLLKGKFRMIKWYLYAELECEGLSLHKKIRINIG